MFSHFCIGHNPSNNRSRGFVSHILVLPPELLMEQLITATVLCQWIIVNVPRYCSHGGLRLYYSYGAVWFME